MVERSFEEVHKVLNLSISLCSEIPEVEEKQGRKVIIEPRQFDFANQEQTQDDLVTRRIIEIEGFVEQIYQGELSGTTISPTN